MGIQEKFSADEWELLAAAPFLAGLAASLADTTPSAFAAEMQTHLKNLESSRRKYKHNSLITAILDDYYNEDGSKPEPVEMPVIQPGDLQEESFEDVMKTMHQRIEELSAAAKLAEEKLPQGEAQEFKQFLYDIAYVVVNAAGEGLFGNWGKKVSQQEAGFLEKLRLALNL